MSNVKKEKGDKRKKRGEEIVLLRDLAPRKDVKGGAGKIIFGAGADSFLKDEEAKKPKKKSQMRKGGES